MLKIYYGSRFKKDYKQMIKRGWAVSKKTLERLSKFLLQTNHYRINTEITVYPEIIMDLENAILILIGF